MTNLKGVDPLADDEPSDRFAHLATVGEKQITHERAVAKKAEPVMAGLVRILGVTVLDIFPQALRDAVDKSYDIWMANPDVYLPTPFDTEQDKLDSLHVMRAYAECSPKGPYTIRTVKDDDPCLLVWRAQTRRGHKDD
jgi:hypothetical protein